MSWTLGNAILQPGDVKSHEGSGDGRTLIFKDVYTDLETKRLALAEGDVIETGWVAKTWSLRPVPGGYGELTINCVPPNPTHGGGGGGGGGEVVTDPLTDIWSIKGCRNDVSLLAYCGPSVGANPLRDQIENWLKETDKDLAAAYSYKDDKGKVVELTEASKALAAKFAKGAQSVMRFYPIVTRKRTYADVPPACLEKLGFIDTPSYSGTTSPVTKKKVPNGLSTAINAHQWLKCQDDADENTDGKWVRTESWMGIPKTDDPNNAPWDADFYGDNRWAMPYQSS